MRRAFLAASGLALTLGACAASALAGSFGRSAIGTSAAEFLKLGAGGRAAGMGEAYAAAAEEADALYWNPAALTNIDHKSATFMHEPYLASSFYDYVAYGRNLGKHGAYGVGLQYFSAGSIAETDQIGTPLGNYSPNDTAFSLGYAYRLDGGYSLGGAAKLIRSTVLDTAQAAAVDFGLLSPAYFGQTLKFAATVTNIGQTMNYGNGAHETLPQALKFGSSFLVNKGWIGTLDVAFPRENAPYVGVGTEYWLVGNANGGAAGRLGYNSLTPSGLQGFAGMSVGVGIAVGGWTMDYALAPYGALGMTHRISLTAHWDTVRWDKISLWPKASAESAPAAPDLGQTRVVLPEQTPPLAPAPAAKPAVPAPAAKPAAPAPAAKPAAKPAVPAAKPAARDANSKKANEENQAPSANPPPAKPGEWSGWKGGGWGH